MSLRVRIFCSCLLCLILCAILSSCDSGRDKTPADTSTTPEEIVASLAPGATPLPISDV